MYDIRKHDMIYMRLIFFFQSRHNEDSLTAVPEEFESTF